MDDRQWVREHHSPRRWHWFRDGHYQPPMTIIHSIPQRFGAAEEYEAQNAPPQRPELTWKPDAAAP